MAQWNQLDKTLNTKIVYWGPALGGKTTNLQQLHAVTDPEGENRLISVNTANDRTLFFDLLPLDMGKILGHSLKIQLYTVPGQVRYEATRRVVLSGADAVVFVADSQRGRGAENRAAWENLRANLKLNGLDPAATPIVVQYNKQDIPGCLHPKEVEACLQSGQQGIAASAITGRGVLETFREAVLAMLRRLTVLTGRRRAEDIAALEEQVARAFMRFEGAQAARALQAAQAAQIAQAAQTAQTPQAAQGGKSPAGQPAGTGAAAAAGPAPSSPTTIRMSEDAPGEDLLVRSLRATLGIAEQFGELREVKNRLARRVGELESLQALVRELTSRREEEEILQGLADAAISIPGARAASVLRRAAEGGPLQEVVVRGAARDPLIGAGGPESYAEELLRAGRPELLHALPLPGGAARVEAGPVTAALAVPIVPEAGPAGLVAVYSDEPFEADDLRFLGLLVSHAAVCLDNAEFALRMKSHSMRLEDEVRERTAELQKANESLLDLDRMKDRFLSSVSHEMRTPLTGILSGIELLTMLNNDIDGSREFLSMIEHEAKRLSNLVERILRFQVLGRTAGPQEPGPLAAGDVVRQVVAELSEKAATRGIEITLELQGHLPLLSGDAEALALAIRELVDNAVKFSPQGEAVQVIVREKMVLPATLEPDGGPGAGPVDGVSEPGGDEPRRYLVIVVRDHGPGIAPEDQARIFERFEQIGNLLTAKPDGIGLGLAIAREIVRRHGGELRVRAGRECGSEFRVYLPVPAADLRREDRTGALETAQ